MIRWFRVVCYRAYRTGDVFTVSLMATVFTVIVGFVGSAVVQLFILFPRNVAIVLGCITGFIGIWHGIWRLVRYVGHTEDARRRLQEKAGYGQP